MGVCVFVCLCDECAEEWSKLTVWMLLGCGDDDEICCSFLPGYCCPQTQVQCDFEPLLHLPTK